MSKVEQHTKAQDLKKYLIKHGVEMGMRVDQNVEISSKIILCLYDKKIGYMSDDNSLFIQFDELSDMEGLFYDDGSPINDTISKDPNIEDIIDFLKKYQKNSVKKHRRCR